MYEKQRNRVFSSQRSRYQPHHYRHLQDRHRLGLDRHHNRRHVDGIGHDNRVDVFDVSQQHTASNGRKLNIRYSARSNPNAGSKSGTIPPSSGKPTLKLVHVVGSKYIDYFTDGTKTYSFPGNPDIDSNLNKPNAPIPTHGNLTWVSTSGMDAYDTPSGDLEVGDYAQESDGSYISNVPAYTYTDATSSVPIAAHIATSKTDPTAATSQ